MTAIEKSPSGCLDPALDGRRRGKFQYGMGELTQRIAEPVSGKSLAMFRILFGLLMTFAMARLLTRGWVKSLYLDPVFHFPWVSWIVPWPGTWMYVHVVLLAFCALGLAFGLYFRGCALLFFLGFTYLELIDQTTFLNHYYLISLLAGLLVFLPVGRCWSVDAWRKPRESDGTAPRWAVWVLRFQIGIVYLFAGLAKLNVDWLFESQPMRIWLAARADLPIIGPWLAEPWMAGVASWLAAAYDLSIPLLLSWARSRAAAYAAVIFFHVLTAILFPIGMFPWIMIAATTIFFPPNWPEEIWFHRQMGAAMNLVIPPGGRRTSLGGKLGAFLLGAYCLAQVVVPLRSWFYPQQGAWDGRGFNFAWRVMLNEKTGHAEFFTVNSATGIRERISIHEYITPRQFMMMAQDPFLIRDLAQFLSRHVVDPDAGWSVHVDAWATLNGRPSQPLIDPETDFGQPLNRPWIVPLQLTP
jgi:vitamin K-dependent gamma-carboxylase